jgi:hypothetical protein
MYNNQRKINITLGQKQFVITVDHDRIKSDPMFLKLRRDSKEILQRIHTQNSEHAMLRSLERMKEISEGRMHIAEVLSGLKSPQ